LARLVAGPMAPLVNRVGRAWPGRAGLRALGLPGGRPAPAFARKPFARKGGSPSDIGDPANTVVLFVDTFSNFQHPEVPRAATEVLRAAGYSVIPVGNVCCGRTQLSKGFVTAAQREAIGTVQRLFPFVEEGVPIVGLEPSCILTLGDEFQSLIPGDPRTVRVGQASVDFETFVSRHAERFLGLDWRPDQADVHVHGHCHQKALGAFENAPSCYGVTGAAVRVIDAGCCGMAGSFGYEHEEVSRLIGEERLAPAVRAAPEGARIAAAGASCRAQIADLTGREALHPAEVLRKALR
jgi:Fe-S oxidoreductase